MTLPSQTVQRRLRANSILMKIAAILLASVVLVSAVMTANTVNSTLTLVKEQAAHAAFEANKLLASNATDAVQIRASGRLTAVFEHLFQEDDGETLYILAVDTDNAVLAAAGPGSAFEAPLQELAAQAMAQAQSVASDDGMLIASPVINAISGKPAGAVASAWTAAGAIAHTRSATLTSTLLAFAILGVAMVGMMFAIGRWIARPILRLAWIVDRLAGSDYDVEVDLDTRGDELGDIGRAVSHLRDALAAADARARENRFRGTAFEASSAAVMMVDADMKIISVNDTVTAIFRHHADSFRANTPGFDPEAVIGQDMDFFHSEALRQRVRTLLLDPANLPYKAEIEMGEARFRLTISRVETDEGALDGFVVEWYDATSEFMNQAILASIEGNQVQAEFALDGTLLNGNRLLADAVGESIDAIVGRQSDQLFDFDARLAAAKGSVLDRVSRGDAVYGQFRLKRPDGKVAVIDGGFAPVLDTRGNLLRIILIGQDVTEAEAKLALAEAERAKLQAAQEEVVEALRVALEHLAEGNLTARIKTAFADDYDRLRLDFNEAASRLQAAMRGVIDNADLIQGEASEISTAADDLSARTERQAATLEQTASALDQLTASVKSSAEGARNANALVEGAREDAEASGEVVREAVGAMGEIEKSSQQISKITGVIDDIAFQTNLLALNAGVEAARAGEAGRGFAVVASEVRALAQRSSDAAREINALISASGGHVRRGVDLVGQAGKALEGIVVSVHKISQNVAEIAQSSQEQSSGLAEINAAMNQLDQVTQQNAAMFEETTAASHALTREAETLTRTMARFQTEDAPAAGSNVVTPSFSSRRTPAIAPPAPVRVAAPNTPVAKRASETVAIDDGGWDEF